MASDITSGCTFTDCTLSAGVKLVVVETANTADNADYFTMHLPSYGIKNLLHVDGVYQSTENSVAVVSAFATSVTAGTLTVTLDSSAGTDKKRVAYVWGIC